MGCGDGRHVRIQHCARRLVDRQCHRSVAVGVRGATDGDDARLAWRFITDGGRSAVRGKQYQPGWTDMKAPTLPLVVGLMLSASVLPAQDRSRYRDFRLGSNLPAVAAVAKVA